MLFCLGSFDNILCYNHSVSFCSQEYFFYISADIPADIPAEILYSYRRIHVDFLRLIPYSDCHTPDYIPADIFDYACDIPLQLVRKNHRGHSLLLSF